MKKAYTMAEVLLSLSLVGFVAMFTIPSVVKNLQLKQYKTSHEVFQTNIKNAMRDIQADEKLTGYNTTKDFVNELQNYIKILKVCDNNHLGDCFGSSFIVDDKEFSINDVKTSKNLGKEYNDDNIGVIFANGVSAIITYNPDCNASGTDHRKAMSCLGIMYDTNGTKKPNKTALDIDFINASYQQSGLTVANLVNEMYCSLSSPIVDCGHSTHLAYDLEQNGITITGSSVGASDLFHCYCNGGCTSMDSTITSCEIIDDD